MEKIMENSLFAQNEVLRWPSAKSLFFVTNHYNLREVLTSRFIGSVLSYDNKYYPDFLELCSGRIPLFTSPLYQDVVDFVSQHDPETSYPVVVELNPRQIYLAHTPVFHYTLSENETAHESAQGGCYAWAGVIPFSSVVAIHFLSDQSKSEFSLRSFSELPNADHLYRVSPQLVATGHSEPNLKDWLAAQTPVDVPSAADFVRMDRVSGAVVICASRTRDLRERKYIEQLATIPQQKSPSPSTRTPYWFQQGFYPKGFSRNGGSPDTNSILFSAVVSVLHRFDWQASRRTLDILSLIEQELDGWGIKSEERALLAEIFDRARRYIRSEKAFEPFKPSTGYDVAKALLLFLLRPDPHQLLAWPQEETGADNGVMLTAASFVGLLVGRKSLSLEFRPEALDMQAAETVVQVLSTLSAYNTSSISAVATESPVDGAVQHDSQPATPEPEVVTEEVKMASDINQEPEPAIAPEPTTLKSKLPSSIKQRLLEADYTQDDKLKAFALALCNEMGWRGCVTSLLVCPGDDDVIMSQVKLKNRKVMAFRINGFAEVIYELNAPRFIELLIELKPTDKRLIKLEKERPL